MAARHVLTMMPPVQNRKPRVFRAIELRANLIEIEVSDVDGIYNEIKFLLPFTLKPAIANDFKLYETNRGKGSTNGRGAILLYKHCS
jgi:hypothetical protein